MLLVAARPVIAQSLAPGSPVRVRLAEPSGEMLEGVLGGITDDSVFIQRAERGDVRLARGSVRTLFEGIREHRESSAAINALAGVGRDPLAFDSRPGISAALERGAQHPAPR